MSLLKKTITARTKEEAKAKFKSEVLEAYPEKRPKKEPPTRPTEDSGGETGEERLKKPEDIDDDDDDDSGVKNNKNYEGWDNGETGGGGYSLSAGYDSWEYAYHSVFDIFIDDVANIESFNPMSESDMTMRRFDVVTYEFIPSDESLLETDGFCVVDQISQIYGPLNSKLLPK